MSLRAFLILLILFECEMVSAKGGAPIDIKLEGEFVGSEYVVTAKIEKPVSGREYLYNWELPPGVPVKKNEGSEVRVILPETSRNYQFNVGVSYVDGATKYGIAVQCNTSPGVFPNCDPGEKSLESLSSGKKSVWIVE